MKLDVTFSHESNQTLHGLLHWNDLRDIEVDNSVFIRIKTKERMDVGQIAITLENHPWIFFFAINPKFRKLGLGTFLLNRAEEYIKDKGYEEVYLHAQKEYEKKLLPFYQKRGYEKQYKDDLCGDEWVMKKNLV